jgi:hypothetical protein
MKLLSVPMVVMSEGWAKAQCSCGWQENYTDAGDPGAGENRAKRAVRAHYRSKHANAIPKENSQCHQ